MNSETKVTYTVIAVLIVLLGGLAYFLQPMGVEELKKTSENFSKTASNSTLTTNNQAQTETITSQAPSDSMDDKKYSSAVITTSKGVIEITFGNKTPVTVANFVKLASSHFYDGVKFHRVIKDFMIQTGDPLSKDSSKKASWGTGGPGYKFNDELKGDEKYPLGTVAMANAGPNTNGSQFFIVTANPSVQLPPSYTVFGKVTKGIETALAIQNVKTDTSDRPTEDISIQKIELR